MTNILYINQKFALAQSSNDPQVLRDLYSSEKQSTKGNPNLISLLVGNPNFPSDLYQSVLADTNWAKYPFIIKALVTNTECPPSLLSVVFTKGSTEIQVAVLLSQHCPIAVFNSALCSSSETLKQLMAEDCNTPSWVLAELLGDYPQVKNHPNYKNKFQCIMERMKFLVLEDNCFQVDNLFYESVYD